MTTSRDDVPYLFVPGWGGSGATHWQTLWADELGGTRVELGDWYDPNRDAWLAAVDAAIAALRPRDPRPPIVVAHSLGCIVAAEWVRSRRAAIRAALFVAPADVERVACPPALRGFGPVPKLALPCRSVVVTSDDDPHVTAERAQELASAWGSRLSVVHAGGHLNAASGLGDWAAGRALLGELVHSTSATCDAEPDYASAPRSTNNAR